MTTFTSRVTHHFLVIKAARLFRQEIEKAGLDNLQVLADAGISIVDIYLNSCSPEEKARIRRGINTFLQMGITADMVLDEVNRRIPELAPIIESRQDYKKSESQKFEAFLKED